MSTKCIVLGEQATERGNKKPIEFKECIKYNGELDSPVSPELWDNIELVCKRDHKYDVMFAYDNGRRDTGHIMLGHWNDGFVA